MSTVSSSSKHPQLMPLRIPSDWMVRFNIFYDEEVIVQSGRFVNSYSFSEDMLSLTQGSLLRGPQGFRIELGWFPPGDPGGKYRLDLVYGSEYEILLSEEVNDRDLVRARIDEWLRAIMELDTRDAVKRHLCP